MSTSVGSGLVSPYPDLVRLLPCPPVFCPDYVAWCLNNMACLPGLLATAPTTEDAMRLCGFQPDGHNRWLRVGHRFPSDRPDDQPRMNPCYAFVYDMFNDRTNPNNVVGPWLVEVHRLTGMYATMQERGAFLDRIRAVMRHIVAVFEAVQNARGQYEEAAFGPQTDDPTTDPQWLARNAMTKLLTDFEDEWPTKTADLYRELDLISRTIQACRPTPMEPPARAKGKNGRRPRMSKAEAEVRVREYLRDHAKENPDGITRDGIAKATGASTGLVSKTAAWEAFDERRKAERTVRSREVQLTDEMIALVPADADDPSELAELMEEQRAEMAAEDRRHGRRHGPS